MTREVHQKEGDAIEWVAVVIFIPLSFTTNAGCCLGLTSLFGPLFSPSPSPSVFVSVYVLVLSMAKGKGGVVWGGLI